MIVEIKLSFLTLTAFGLVYLTVPFLFSGAAGNQHFIMMQQPRLAYPQTAGPFSPPSGLAYPFSPFPAQPQPLQAQGSIPYHFMQAGPLVGSPQVYQHYSPVPQGLF